jgi:hypothetical protein
MIFSLIKELLKSSGVLSLLVATALVAMDLVTGSVTREDKQSLGALLTIHFLARLRSIFYKLKSIEKQQKTKKGELFTDLMHLCSCIKGGEWWCLL